MPFLSFSPPPSPFPTYLVPSLPFRRRKSSTDSNASVATSSSSTSPVPESYLAGHASHLRCARCLSDLALSSQIISKGFTGRHGRAYLVAPSTSALSVNPSNLASTKARNDALPNLPNTYTHKPVPRQLVTGAHTVGDISCAQCGSVLGWKYVSAEADEQKYKVGKFILETKRVCRSSTWESADEASEEVSWLAQRRYGLQRRGSLAPPSELAVPMEDEEAEFDSQDDEECEELFRGTWTPQLATELRSKRRAFRKLDR